MVNRRKVRPKKVQINPNAESRQRHSKSKLSFGDLVKPHFNNAHSSNVGKSPPTPVEKSHFNNEGQSPRIVTSISNVGKSLFGSMYKFQSTKMGKSEFKNVDASQFENKRQSQFKMVGKSQFKNVGKSMFQNMGESQFENKRQSQFKMVGKSQFKNVGKSMFQNIGQSQLNSTPPKKCCLKKGQHNCPMSLLKDKPERDEKDLLKIELLPELASDKVQQPEKTLSSAESHKTGQLRKISSRKSCEIVLNKSKQETNGPKLYALKNDGLYALAQQIKYENKLRDLEMKGLLQDFAGKESWEEYEVFEEECEPQNIEQCLTKVKTVFEKINATREKKISKYKNMLVRMNMDMNTMQEQIEGFMNGLLEMENESLILDADEAESSQSIKKHSIISVSDDSIGSITNSKNDEIRVYKNILLEVDLHMRAMKRNLKRYKTMLKKMDRQAIVHDSSEEDSSVEECTNVEEDSTSSRIGNEAGEDEDNVTSIPDKINRYTSKLMQMFKISQTLQENLQIALQRKIQNAEQNKMKLKVPNMLARKGWVPTDEISDEEDRESAKRNEINIAYEISKLQAKTADLEAEGEKILQSKDHITYVYNSVRDAIERCMLRLLTPGEKRNLTETFQLTDRVKTNVNDNIDLAGDWNEKVTWQYDEEGKRLMTVNEETIPFLLRYIDRVLGQRLANTANQGFLVRKKLGGRKEGCQY